MAFVSSPGGVGEGDDGDGAKAAGDGRMGPAAGLQVATEAFDVRAVNLEQVQPMLRCPLGLGEQRLDRHGQFGSTGCWWWCTIAGYYRYAVEEKLLRHSPVVHVRRPRLDYESHAIGLDRNEVGSLRRLCGSGLLVP